MVERPMFWRVSARVHVRHASPLAPVVQIYMSTTSLELESSA